MIASICEWTMIVYGVSQEMSFSPFVVLTVGTMAFCCNILEVVIDLNVLRMYQHEVNEVENGLRTILTNCPSDFTEAR